MVVVIVAIVLAIVIAMVVAPQVAAVDRATDVASQPGARLLIEAEMDPAVDARVVDIVGDLLESGVLQRHGDPSDGLDSVMAWRAGSIDTLEHLGAAVAPARVV